MRGTRQELIAVRQQLRQGEREEASRRVDELCDAVGAAGGARALSRPAYLRARRDLLAALRRCG